MSLVFLKSRKKANILYKAISLILKDKRLNAKPEYYTMKMKKEKRAYSLIKKG